MKLLITSIDAIIDIKSNRYFPGVKKALDSFIDLEEGNSVCIISLNEDKLRAIPSDYKKRIVNKYDRKRAELIREISKDLDFEYSDIIILGGKDDDFYLAANAKLLLLTADYSKENNPSDRIFTEGYGIAIYSPDRLNKFFSNYLDIKEPWFYSVEVDDDTKLYGLTDAMTRKERNPDIRLLGNKLQEFLKTGDKTNKNPFFIYSLLSVYRIFYEMNDIYYWGYYPSSTTNVNEELYAFKEILRKSFKSSMTKEDILIRTKDSIARKTMSPEKRINDGCDSQFETIIVNPWFKNKIKSKNVCIIDDFSTHGSSCETVRHLLKKAGANKIIFISLGKFGYDYKKYNYKIDGDVFKENGYAYKKIGTYKKLTGETNNTASEQLLQSLKDLVS